MVSSRLILKASSATDRVVALPANIVPQAVTCRVGDSAVIEFSNGITCSGHCLRCSHRPCVMYSKDELKFADRFPGFTPDRDLRVCPTDAITWDSKNRVPVIDSAKCINCGCCALRCPSRAIYFRDGQFRVRLQSDTPTSSFVFLQPGKLGSSYVPAEKAFSCATYRGSLVAETDVLLNEIYGRITKAIKKDSRIPNLLARNLLLAIGIEAANSRCGDVYSRTDILYSVAGKFGLCEVEFNDTMIDTPRDIIEDVAIYISRYGIRRKDIIPLVVGLQYPNKRSEFWEVLTDIKNVLGISTGSLTIGALFMLVWNQYSLRGKTTIHIPIVDNLHKGIKNEISAMLGRQVRVGSKLLYNVLEPLK